MAGASRGHNLLMGETPKLQKESPCLVMEVLSPSTEAQDRREKMRAYLGLASLQAYPILNPESKGLEEYPRGNGL